MKKIIPLLILSSFFLNAFAQRRQNVYFFKKDGREVKLRDSADFIRIIREPETGKKNYELVEYYSDNSLKREGEVSSLNKNPVLEGKVTSYYRNGGKESILNYEKNKLIDTCLKFFNGGKLQEIGYYEKTSNGSFYKLIQLYNSDGSPYLDEGSNGYVKRIIPEDKSEEGQYNNGKKVGLWKESLFKNKLDLEEEYVDGIIVKGTSKDEKGILYSYKTRQQLPEFKGGIPKFYSFLSGELNYPEEERRNRIQGKVVISFIVNEEGTLSNMKILKSVSPNLDNEAVRVLSLSPKWKPGLEYGRPTKTSYFVPIAFSIPKN